jgi:hypothetical protein
MAVIQIKMMIDIYLDVDHHLCQAAFASAPNRVPMPNWVGARKESASDRKELRDLRRINGQIEMVKFGQVRSLQRRLRQSRHRKRQRNQWANVLCQFPVGSMHRQPVPQDRETSSQCRNGRHSSRKRAGGQSGERDQQRCQRDQRSRPQTHDPGAGIRAQLNILDTLPLHPREMNRLYLV